MEPYIYVSNNPINLIDPTGMELEDWIFTFTNGFLTNFTDTGSGKKVVIIENGTVIPSFKPNYNINNQRSQIINIIGNKLDSSVSQYSYKSAQKTEGGFYNPNDGSITVTNRAFNTDNYYDMVNTIEHEIFHKINGKVNSYMDHVKVYMQQAGTDAFEKPMNGNKHSNAVGTGKRLLNAYVKGEIDSSGFDDKINKYNKLNPSFQLI